MSFEISIKVKPLRRDRSWSLSCNSFIELVVSQYAFDVLFSLARLFQDKIIIKNYVAFTYKADHKKMKLIFFSLPLVTKNVSTITH